MIDLPLLINRPESLPSAEETAEDADINISFQAALALLSTEGAGQHLFGHIALLGKQEEVERSLLLPGGSKLPIPGTEELQPIEIAEGLRLTDTDNLLLPSNMLVSSVEAAVKDPAAPPSLRTEIKDILALVLKEQQSAAKQQTTALNNSAHESKSSEPLLALPQQRLTLIAPYTERGNTSSQDQAFALQAMPQLLQARQGDIAVRHAHSPSQALPVRDPTHFSEQLSNRLVLLVNERQYTANLRLNPPELGPLEVRINLYNDQANISFISQHAAVREAIEDTFPRLREMLQENGLNLGNTNIAHQSPRQRNPDREYFFYSDPDAQEDERTDSTVTQSDQGWSGRKLLQTFLIDHYV